jgi:hypothetical protein
MRTRAVAIPSDRSNAVGPVEVECTSEGLVIVHQGVGAFQEGYAPAAVTSGTRLVVPWSQVKASLEGDRVFFQIDEALTPHHRLLLSGFSTGNAPSLRELRRQRLILRLGTGACMLVAGLLVAVTAARFSTDTGATAAILLGCLSAGMVFALGMVADRRLVLGGNGLEAEAARAGFVTDLAAHVPELATVPPPEPPTEPAPLSLPTFQTLLPRSTTAVVITMSAALLGAALTANWLSRTPPPDAERPAYAERDRFPAPPEPATALGRTASQAPAAAPDPQPRTLVTNTPAVAPPPAPPSGTQIALTGAACTCQRADSLLWRDGLPRMSTVLIDRRQHEHNGHIHLDLELGVVNNWSQVIPDVSLVVQFYERDPPPSTKRVPTFDRPLYFEGPLEPGQAIKWHVEARGNDFEVVAPPQEMLDPSGSDAAPTNLLVDLLKAIHRPIRLHGAMMLAYLGDSRARDGALSLREALREDEAPYIDRLLWTLGGVRTCNVDAAESAGPRTVSACVYNSGNAPRSKLALKVRALDRPFRHDTPVEAPPLVVAEHAYELAGDLAPNHGAMISVSFDTANPDGIVPKAFEVVADREDLVF